MPDVSTKEKSQKFIGLDMPKLKYEKAEMNLIYYMLKDSKVILQYYARKIYLPTEKYRFLVREICAYYQKYGNINIADFKKSTIGINYNKTF